MNSPKTIARALATAMLSVDLDVDAAVERGCQLLGNQGRWLRPLARRVLSAYVRQPRPRHRDVQRFILEDDGFGRAHRKYALEIVDLEAARPVMRSIPEAAGWGLPVIHTGSELAEWLCLAVGELEWFADRWQFGYKRNQPRLRHYHYRMLAKPGGQIRLIESPKTRLKQLQRSILRDLLDQVPPHDAAHGFRRGRSITSFAAPHVGQRVVLRLDLRDFFPTIRAAQVAALFRTLGYPETVADLLTGLCTNSAPEDVWNQTQLTPGDAEARHARWRYSQRHLPQGSPTSPALANLAAYRMDCRLAALAQASGAAYTRYADDLAFSGGRDFEQSVERFGIHVAATVMEEGFRVQHRKTRIMRRGVRQRLAGLVVNAHVNVPRRDFDNLKATLTNCIRLGAASQNRTGQLDYRRHLDGRVSYVEMVNPRRGRKLRTLYETIDWDE